MRILASGSVALDLVNHAGDATCCGRRPPRQLLKPQDVVPICFRPQASPAHRLTVSQRPAASPLVV